MCLTNEEEHNHWTVWTDPGWASSISSDCLSMLADLSCILWLLLPTANGRWFGADRRHSFLLEYMILVLIYSSSSSSSCLLPVRNTGTGTCQSDQSPGHSAADSELDFGSGNWNLDCIMRGETCQCMFTNQHVHSWNFQWPLADKPSSCQWLMDHPCWLTVVNTVLWLASSVSFFFFSLFFMSYPPFKLTPPFRLVPTSSFLSSQATTNVMFWCPEHIVDSSSLSFACTSHVSSHPWVIH